MRLDSAEDSSDFCLPRSVAMKRLEISAMCPTSSRVQGTISCIQVARVVISTKCTAISTTRMTPVTTAAGAALRRGSSTMRYRATSTNTTFSTSHAHVGATKKCSCRIEDTECASVSTGGMAGDTGVTDAVPTPAAVAPISTILSAYLVAGILPVSTS
jgi:hypothetical protein